jgi:hypothetical protein
MLEVAGTTAPVVTGSRGDIAVAVESIAVGFGTTPVNSAAVIGFGSGPSFLSEVGVLNPPAFDRRRRLEDRPRPVSTGDPPLARPG